MGEDDPDDRAAILRRRAVFVMSALAGIGLASCGDDTTPPRVCLSPIRPPTSSQPGARPDDAGPTDAGADASSTDAGPEDAGPKPQPPPPHPPPDVCLKVSPRK